PHRHRPLRAPTGRYCPGPTAMPFRQQRQCPAAPCRPPQQGQVIRSPQSPAHQAIGMLHREFGDLAAATAELNAAVRLARASRSPERESDVLATLGVTLTYRGHSRRGLAALGRSLTLVGGEAAARVLVRRGIALWVLGRHAEALDDLGRSIRVLRE